MANYRSFSTILYDILLLSIIAILIAEMFLPCSHNQTPYFRHLLPLFDNISFCPYCFSLSPHLLREF